MGDLIIRPSMKKVWVLYGCCVLLLLGGCAVYARYQPATWPNWPVVLPVLLFVWPVIRHLERAFTSLTVSGGRLRYQEGVLSRTTRTMDLSRLQDVRVDQSMWQRMVNIGSISLETAGEAGRLVMESIDSPHQRADAIMEASHRRGGDAPPTTGL